MPALQRHCVHNTWAQGPEVGHLQTSLGSLQANSNKPLPGALGAAPAQHGNPNMGGQTSPSFLIRYTTTEISVLFPKVVTLLPGQCRHGTVRPRAAFPLMDGLPSRLLQIALAETCRNTKLVSRKFRCLEAMLYHKAKRKHRQEI